MDGAKKTSKQVSYTFAYYLSYTCAKEDVPVSWEAVQGAMFPPANPLSRVVAGLQFNTLFACLTKVTAAALILWIISHYFHLFFCAEGFGFKQEAEEDCNCSGAGGGAGGAGGWGKENIKTGIIHFCLLYYLSHYFHLFFCAEGFGFKREEECKCIFQHIGLYDTFAYFNIFYICCLFNKSDQRAPLLL